MVKFIPLLSCSRSGSSYLRVLLNSFEHINCFGEVFKVKEGKFERRLLLHRTRLMQYFSQKCWPTNFDYIFHTISKEKEVFFDAMLATCPKDYWSIKILNIQLKKFQLLDLLQAEADYVILLKRTNILDMFISSQKAKILGIFDKKNKDTTGIKVEVAPEKFMKFYENRTRFYREAEDTFSNLLVLTYEDIHTHETNTQKFTYVQQQLKTIGIESEFSMPNKLAAKIDKSPTIQDKVTNYDELATFLEKQNLSHFIY